MLVVLTDGRANIGLDGTPGRAAGERDALAAAARIGEARIGAAFLDTSARAQPGGDRFARAMGGRLCAAALCRRGPGLRSGGDPAQRARLMFAPSKPEWKREGRDWPNREASRFVLASGLWWHVQVMGSGPVLLLLHGTGAATHSWRDCRAAPRARLHRRRPRPARPWLHPDSRRRRPVARTAWRGEVAALMHGYGPERPSSWSGTPPGAAIALRMAIDRGIAPGGDREPERRAAAVPGRGKRAVPGDGAGCCS